MRAFAAVLRRELAERWLLALAAALLGLIPLAVPFLPLGISRSPDARSGTAAALAVIVSYVLALVLGSTVLARDLSERRLGFYFSRPLPGWAIWAGKMAGALLLAVGSGVLVLLPSLLLGDRPDPSGSWGWGLGPGDGGSALSLGLWAATVLALVLAANAFGTMLRSRSPWLLLDLLAGTVLAGIFGVVTGRLLSAWALGALTLAHVGLLAALTLSLGAASAVQVTRARTDARRGHRLLSLTLWALLGVAVLAFGAYAQWVLAADPEDLVTIGGAAPAPAGDWIAVSGATGKLRGSFEPAFLLDTSSGRSFRLKGNFGFWDGVAFSRDGRHAAWLQLAGRKALPATIQRLDLGRPGAQPAATPIGFSEHLPRSLVLSPDGSRMACLVEERIVAQEMRNGKLLLAAQVLPGEVWNPDRLRFLDSRTLRWYGSRLQEGKRELRVVDYDLGTGRSVREVRVPGGNHAVRGISPDGQRLLLRTWTLQPGREEVAVADLRTGEPPVVLAAKGWQTSSFFLSDGRLVIAKPDRGRIDLRLLDERGAELRRFVLTGSRFRLGGQPAPGLLAVVIRRDPSETGWQSHLLDLESGALRPIGRLLPHGWPGLPAGSIGTRLFSEEGGGLVRIDPATGRRTVILHPG